jgi:biotin carboxylase/carbonic anhydrase/acetyltransferase-like protein (isoleucine patch superfamily)
MTSVAFVESNRAPGSSGLRAMRHAREVGLRVILLTRDRRVYGRLADPGGFLDRYVSDLVPCETSRAAEIAGAVAGLDEMPAALLSFSDSHVLVAAEAARQLGLRSAEPAALRRGQDKHQCRLRCRAAGIRVPRFALAADLDAALRGARAVGLPCVVKPVEGSGSRAVRLCRSEADVRLAWAEVAGAPPNAFGQRPRAAALVEQFLVGPEVSVETVTRDHTTTAVGVTDKTVAGTPFFIEMGHSFPSTLPAGVARRCEETAAGALEAIGLDLGVCHVELRLVDGEPYVIEANLRPGGRGITDLVEHAAGVSLVSAFLALHLGGRPELRPTRRRGAAMRFLTAAPGVVVSVRGAEAVERVPGVEAVVVTVVPGDRVRPLVTGDDRVGHVIVTAGDAPAAVRLAERTAAAIRIEIAPDMAAEAGCGPRPAGAGRARRHLEDSQSVEGQTGSNAPAGTAVIGAATLAPAGGRAHRPDALAAFASYMNPRHKDLGVECPQLNPAPLFGSGRHMRIGFPDVHPSVSLWGHDTYITGWVVVGEGTAVYPGCNFMADATMPLNIGRRCSLQHVELHYSGFRRLATTIGDDTFMSHLAFAHSVTIGRGCYILGHVTMYDGAQVGDDVFIEGNSTILGTARLRSGWAYQGVVDSDSVPARRTSEVLFGRDPGTGRPQYIGGPEGVARAVNDSHLDRNANQMRLVAARHGHPERNQPAWAVTIPHVWQTTLFYLTLAALVLDRQGGAGSGDLAADCRTLAGCVRWIYNGERPSPGAAEAWLRRAEVVHAVAGVLDAMEGPCLVDMAPLGGQVVQDDLDLRRMARKLREVEAAIELHELAWRTRDATPTHGTHG